MPNYDYECLGCGDRFEVFQSMAEEPLKSCPKCGQSVKRLIGGGGGILFKGSGFYQTDYKKPAKKTESSTSKNDSKTSSPKPETGTKDS